MTPQTQGQTPTISQMLDRRERSTWNYEAMTILDRVTRFMGAFFVSMFVLSLIIRAAVGVL